MANDDFEWNLDDPLEEGEMISKWRLRDLLPGLSVQDAEDIIFYSEQFGVNTADKIHLINHIIYTMRRYMLTWNVVQWRWVVEHLSNLVAKSKERNSAVNALIERVAEIDKQQKTMTNELSLLLQKVPPQDNAPVTPPRPQSDGANEQGRPPIQPTHPRKPSAI